MNAILALEDGTWFRGVVGRRRRARPRGEVVFNTSMTGYQEVLTDPSYAGQIVTMTCAADRQLRRVAGGRRVARAAGRRLHHARGVAGGEQLARATARCATTSSRNGIVAIADIDTRALTRDAALGRRDARRHRHRRRLDPTALVERARAHPARWKAPTWCATSPADAPFDWPRRRIRTSSASPPERRAKRRAARSRPTTSA